MKYRAFGAAGVFAAVMTAAPAMALVQFDQDVTSNVIFGTGNANGGWTTDRENGIELGLRAKVRFDVINNQPANIFNSNGDGSYDHAAGAPPSNLGRPRWNFEWSINSNFDGTNPSALNDLQYVLRMDYDPGVGTNFLSFDPINVTFADHSIGNNGTASNAGTEATDAANYAALIDGNNLAQNSWSLSFFVGPQALNPNRAGQYTFQLLAYEAGVDTSVAAALAEVDILVNVPEPASAALLLGGLAAFGAMRRRKAA